MKKRGARGWGIVRPRRNQRMLSRKLHAFDKVSRENANVAFSETIENPSLKPVQEILGLNAYELQASGKFSAAEREDTIQRMQEQYKKIEDIARRGNVLDGRIIIFLSRAHEGTLMHTKWRAIHIKWQATWLKKIRAEAESARAFIREYPPEWVRKVRIVHTQEPLKAKLRKKMGILQQEIAHASSITNRQKPHAEAMMLIQKAETYFKETKERAWFLQWRNRAQNLLPKSTICKLEHSVEFLENELRAAQEQMHRKQVGRSRAANKALTAKMTEAFKARIGMGASATSAFDEIAHELNDNSDLVKQRIYRRLRAERKVALQYRT